MTLAVQNLIASFEALPDAEKHQAAVTILQRYVGPNVADVPDAGLVDCADALFYALDSEEAVNASG